MSDPKNPADELVFDVGMSRQEMIDYLDKASPGYRTIDPDFYTKRTDEDLAALIMLDQMDLCPLGDPPNYIHD